MNVQKLQVKVILKILIISSLLIFSNNTAQVDSILSVAQKFTPKRKLDFLLQQTWEKRGKAPSEALIFGKKSINLAEELNDKSNLAKGFNFLGVIYRNIGEYDSSYQMYKRALDIAKSIKDSMQMAYAFNNIGGYYGYQHEYFLALEYVFNAREIFKKLKNLRGEAFCDIKLGLWYTTSEQYDMALKELNRAIEIREKIKDEFGITVAKSLIEQIYLQNEEYDKAYHLALQLLETFKKFKDKRGIGIILGTLGGIHFCRGNYKQALAYRTKALRYLEKVKYPNGIVNNLNGLGLIYHKLNKDDKAIRVLNKSIKIAKKFHYDKGLIDAYFNFVKIYRDNNEMKKLALYHQKAINISDSLGLLEKKTRLNEFKKIFLINKLNRDNLILENELQKNKIIFHALFLLGLLIVVFAVVFYLQNKKLKRERKLLQESNFTKDKLFSIIAHDLKSPFSALFGYSEMMLSDFDDFSRDEIKENLGHIKSVSQNLFAMVENLLQWARNQTQGIKHEPEIVELEGEIEKVLSNFEQSASIKNISLERDLENGLKVFCDVSMLQTVLRNLINNAIKFTRPNGKITVRAKVLPEEGKVKISVEDTGIGMTEKQIEQLLNKKGKSTHGTGGEKGTGLGMLLVNEMVKHNGGELSIESEVEKGTTISFTVPLVKNEE